MHENGFEIQLNESRLNSSSKASIEIRAMYSNGNPVKGLIIKLVDSEIESETNQSGISTIKIDDALFKDHLKINSAIIPIDLRGYDRIIAIVFD